MVQGTVNQVTDIGDGLNQRVNQCVLTAVGLHLKTGDAELRIRGNNGNLGSGHSLLNDLGNSLGSPNLQRGLRLGTLSNQRQHRRAVKMVRMRVGHEQVIGAFQRGGVFAFCSKVAGVKNEGAPLILKADT